MAQGLELLAVKRVNTIMTELRDQRDLQAPLTFLEATPVIDATDSQILGRFQGNVYVSDIIFEGATAIVKGGQKYSTETWKIPKIKHGSLIDEEMLALLLRLEAGGGTNFDELTVRGFVANRLEDILRGIRERQELMIIAMYLDSFSYDRGGVQINGAGFGSPAAMKTTVGTYWTVAADATPIMDITTQAENDLEVYGETRNRITLRSEDLRLIFETDEFKDKAVLFFPFPPPAGTFPLTASLGQQKEILVKMLDGMILRTIDGRYWDQLPGGAEKSWNYWPLGKVMLDNTDNDNNPRAAYLGNAVVTETTVSALTDVGGIIGRFEGPQSGPVAYTVASHALNPPDLTCWGVAKCWPVRFRRGLSSILTVRAPQGV